MEFWPFITESIIEGNIASYKHNVISIGKNETTLQVLDCYGLFIAFMKTCGIQDITT